jgi:hypothetical protein
VSSDYVAGHVQEALAHAGETDVQAAVRGSELVLTGTVTTVARRTAVLSIASQHGDGLAVRDEIDVLQPTTPDDEREVLS